MFTKFLLLIAILIIACLFAMGLLFRLIRTAQQLGELHKKIAVNDFELQSQIESLKSRETEESP